MSKVTILVAVYNAEAYLEKCLRSLLGQTLHDIQVVAIDDASTDTSSALLEKFAREDSRLVVLHLSENQGQAVARNRGMEVADGQFITMVDSDDWLAPDALQQAWNVLEQHPQTDAVLFDLWYHYQADGREVRFENRTAKEVLTGEEGMQLSLDWQIHGLYLIRADIQRHYPYDTACRLYSDDNTTRIHFLHAREIRFCQGRYYYRQHPASMTQAVSIRYFDSMAAEYSLHRTLVQEGVSSSILRQFENHRWLKIVDCCWYYFLYHRSFAGQKNIIKKQIRCHAATICPRDLAPRNRWKFGYIPLPRCFTLFWLQEAIYCNLRLLIGRTVVL